MKPFKKFIRENFSITRINMPQIEDIKDFCSFITQYEVQWEKNIGPVSNLKPSQSEGFNEYKIRNIAMQMRKDPESIKKMKPIITSNDGFVIDGHHRYLAAIRMKENIPYIVVDTNANKLLKMAYDFTRH